MGGGEEQIFAGRVVLKELLVLGPSGCPHSCGSWGEALL